MPDWDVSLVTDMSGGSWSAGGDWKGFGNKTTFNGDIGRWNTAQVTDMSYMFTAAYAFNQDIGSWDTSQVTNMGSMFYQATSYDQDTSPLASPSSTYTLTGLLGLISATVVAFVLV